MEVLFPMAMLSSHFEEISATVVSQATLPMLTPTFPETHAQTDSQTISGRLCKN
jgi:hypothetical protein